MPEKKFSQRNISNRDSEGNELTEAQQEYFKDSKVRDEDGKLLKVYHGTDAEFTVFDRTKGRSNADIQGMFFSPWDIEAGGYGGNVKSYYLNITNPASESLGYKALKKFQGQNNVGIKAREYLISLGYDGVANYDEYIAFYPEQIKLVENEKPTNDPDIRFSIRNGAKAEIKKALNDKFYREEIMLTETTPSIITSQKGTKNLPMLMKSSHIRENIFTEEEAKKAGLKTGKDINYHGLGEELFIKVIDGLENVEYAYRGTKNAEDTTRRGNYFLLISQYRDKDGNIINVPVYINEVGNFNHVYISTNKIATVFGKSGFYKYIQTEVRKGNLVKIKNRSNSSSELTAPIAADYVKNASADSIIRTNEEKSQEQNSRRNTYSYNELTSKPDMEITVVDMTKVLNRADTVAEAKKNAAKVGTRHKDGSVSVKVKDINKEVLLTTSGLSHSLYRNLETISPITSNIGNILINSIKLNELEPKKQNVKNSYVLLGAATDNANIYLVRTVINSYFNKVESFDVLYAINAKKETAVTKSPGLTINKPLSVTASFISISDLLEYVNKYFPDILSEDVLKHFGHSERPSGELGKSALFSARNTLSEAALLNDKMEEREKERMAADVKRLNSLNRFVANAFKNGKIKESTLQNVASVIMKSAGLHKGNNLKMIRMVKGDKENGHHHGR